MNQAALDFVARYTRPDGTLKWRKDWPGMDGSDDGYESFLTFPLLYILGGAEHLNELARRLWNAVTWQFTGYGQVEREFDGYYDWMHHGECSTYIYYLALADPEHHVDRTRALRFADMYTGADPLAPNWDAAHRMMRSPINGSRGPRSAMSAEDWMTHRPVLARYLSPYEDVPGLDPDDPFAVADWNDDGVFASILELMNRRMVPGDVPLNLNATSLVTNAWLYGGEPRYRNWILDYLDAWVQRTEDNGGIMPDNIGPSGRVGELMDGRWWGGYYGWRWPHGAWIMLESTLIAGANATLLTGDPSWLDLHRSQADLLWSLRREQDGKVTVPFRHGRGGWFDYRPMRSVDPIHLWFIARSAGDRRRILDRFPDRSGWYNRPATFGKAGHFHPEPWFGWVSGENARFPDQVLDDTCRCMMGRLDAIDSDDWSKMESWDVHHWQNLNPVVPEGLIQMAMGSPAAVYHGGLLHATVRYFDPRAARPGLPPDVAALVESIEEKSTRIRLVNTNPTAVRSVLIQAGSFGEHRFLSARCGDGSPIRVDGSLLRVEIGPWTNALIDVEMKRYAGRPGYAHPNYDSR
jgi:hypothetical protein